MIVQSRQDSILPTVDWTQVDHVLLDMDGTLLDLEFDNNFWGQRIHEQYARLNDISLQATVEKFTPIFRSVAGTLDWYSTDFWSDQYGYDIIEYSRTFAEGIRFLPYAENFLTALKSTGIRSTIVTNAHPDILALKNSHTGIADRVDEAISSHSIGFAKESQYFWQRTQTRLGFNKAKTLFFDDSAAVIKAALKFGIAGSVSVCLPDTSRPKNVPHSNYAIDQFQDVWPSPLGVSER